MNALHAAAYNGDHEAVLQLLADHSSVNARDESGYAPLPWASFRAAVTDQVSVAQTLIEAGADPNAVTEAGDSNCLMLAAQAGSEPVVTALVAGGAMVDGAADGVTALMVAARHGETKIVELLLERGAIASIRCGSSLLPTALGMVGTNRWHLS